MSHSAIADRICHIPEDYDTGNRSTASLVKESGVVERPDALIENDVADVLKSDPKLIDRWMKRGGDQRMAGGWVMDCEGNVYRLKNFETGKSSLIPDKYQALAGFIVRYVSRIGAVIRKYEGPATRSPR